MEANYKRTVAGSVGAGVAAVFNGSGRQYYILEHKTESLYHHAGESQKIIVDQVELGRDSACQVRFDEAFETVSRRHAAIVKDGENWKIIPLSQTNSTIVNGTPIQGEQVLNSGDEIRLSSKGPLMGFIIPQGKQSLVSSIGMTERLSLFRQQALRPYKRALWIMAIVLVLAVGGLLTWTYLLHDDLKKKEQQIEDVTYELVRNEKEINELNRELDNSKHKSAEEREALIKSLEAAQAEREALIQDAQVLRDELQVAAEAAEQAGKDANSANTKLEELNQKLEEAAKAAPVVEEVKEKEVKIYTKEAKAPVLKKEGVNEEPALDKKEEGAKKTLKKF